MRKFLSQHAEYVWVIGLTILLLLCAYVPIFRNYQRVSTDRYYFGAEEFPIDQLGNLAYVRQGYQGDAFGTFNYSIFLGRHPSIVKFEYVLIGHLARSFRVDPVVMFRISQFTLSLLYMLTAYIIIRSVISSKGGRIIAYAFVLFGSGIVRPGEQFGFPDGVVYDVLVFIRMTLSMPHYLLGGICSMMSLYFLSKSLRHPHEYASFVIASTFGVFTSFFYAPNIVLIVSGFPLYIIFSAISRYMRVRRITVNMSEISILIAYTVIILIPILYVRYIVGYYWQDLNTAKMEFLNPFVLTYMEYVLALGLTYALSLVAVIPIVKKGHPLLMLFATWTIMHPIGEFALSGALHLNPIRYFLTPYFVVFGVLAATFVVEIVSVFRGYKIYALILVIVLGSSVISYQKTFQRMTNCFCQPDMLSFGYPQKTIMNSMLWLSAHTTPGEVVLSGYHAGMLIPAFSGNRVYTSWWYKLIEPPSFPAVLDALAGFYRQSVTPESAYSFLRASGISYVYYSKEEHLLSPSVWGLQYSFLSEVYNQGDVIIYKVW